MLKIFIDWLMETPGEKKKPSDLRAYEASKDRLNKTTEAAEEGADEIGRMITRMRKTRARHSKASQ